MKKKILSTLMATLLFTSFVPTIAQAETNSEVGQVMEVSANLKAVGVSSISVYASGDVSYDYNGKTYWFNMYTDYVGYGFSNKFAAVQYAQLSFNGAIGSGLKVDGLYGPNTYNATIKYQQIVGVTADGIIGPNTWLKM